MALVEPPTDTPEPTSLVRTASVPINSDVRDDSALEEGRRAGEPFLLSADINNAQNEGNASSSTSRQHTWRNLSSISFSSLGGDARWQSERNDRSR